ncbi:unnamed protein product [Brassicogethes aeneus]|uniref:UDP-glucuronosyltransferase n=1 Tax=Brassicogethes aeneus TaxID=1431903 RepID=A0A9P0FLQ9_BRAAE|nr:unnamed protein product [Brassicogethes aeneus]
MIKFLLSSFICVNLVSSAKILGYFPIPSISHQCVFQPIWKELSLRGHEVTVITPDPLKDPNLVNLTEIDVSFTYKDIKEYVQTNILHKSTIDSLTGLYDMMRNIEEDILKHEKVQQLLNDDDKHFDLVIMELFTTIGFGFGSKYKAPVVGVTSLNGYIQIHESLGNPIHPALYAECFSTLGGDMTFFERLQNTAFFVWFKIYHHYYNNPRHDAIARKYFGEDMPYIGDLEKNISFALINTNAVMDYVKANVPAVIEIGQMHIKPPKPLPKDIGDYLDNSKREVIYFSLGSNVKSSTAPENFLDTVKVAITELPYNFIWKWEDDHMPNKPDNVFLKKWLPQQDILRHPKIKGFITQGGIQSMEEAVTNGVPLVVFPFFGDQPYNARRMVYMGIGSKLDYTSFTKEDFKNAVNEIVKNPMYKHNVKKYQSLIKDQPMTGLEKAVWWIEFTIRHKGDFNLKSNLAYLPYYKYFMLDIILFVLILVVILSVVIAKLFKLFFYNYKSKKEKSS